MRNVRITEAITILGHQILTRENAHAEDDDGGLAWVRQESVSATATTGRDANGKSRGRAKGAADLEAFL
jgi:hypothetical protein